MFNPEYTGKENIYYSCALQGMKKKDIDSIYDEIVKFSELEEFIDMPVKKYSSGMKARLGFATSINIEPDILILDEILAVGDELFRRKCYSKMEELFNKGKTILFVSHSLATIKEICNRAILIHKGKLVIDSNPSEVIEEYQKVDKIESDIIGKYLKIDEKINRNEMNITPKNCKIFSKGVVSLSEIGILKDSKFIKHAYRGDEVFFKIKS